MSAVRSPRQGSQPDLQAVEQCPLCETPEHGTVLQAPPFEVRRCGSCDLVYTSPRVPDAGRLERLYGEGYWRGLASPLFGYADYFAEREEHRRTFERRLDAISEELPAPGCALDVGCATGELPDLLRRRGWAVSALEPSRPARDLACELLGPEAVSANPIERARLTPDSLDLVTLFDLLEDLPDPVSVLTRVRRALKPEGRLLLWTGNVESAAARRFGGKWRRYRHLERLMHVSPRTLTHVLAKAELEVVRIDRTGRRYVTPRGLRAELARRGSLSGMLIPPLSGPSLYVGARDGLLTVARPRR